MDMNDVRLMVNFRDHFGGNLLHRAVHQANDEVVKELVEMGCDINGIDYKGNTPILLADFRKPKIIGVLVCAGACVNVQCGEYGNTPLHVTALLHSNVSSCMRSIRLLLRAGIDVNKQNKIGETALARAISLKHMDIAKVLLDEGAIMNLVDSELIKELDLTEIEDCTIDIAEIVEREN